MFFPSAVRADTWYSPSPQPGETLTRSRAVITGENPDAALTQEMDLLVPQTTPWVLERSLFLGTQPGLPGGAWFPLAWGLGGQVGYAPELLYDRNDSIHEPFTGFRQLRFQLAQWPLAPQPAAPLPGSAGPRIAYAYFHVSLTWWSDGPVVARWIPKDDTTGVALPPVQAVFTQAELDLGDPTEFFRQPAGVGFLTFPQPSPIGLSFSVFTPADPIPGTTPLNTWNAAAPGQSALRTYLLARAVKATSGDLLNDFQRELWPPVSTTPPVPRSPVTLTERSFFRVRSLPIASGDANGNGVPDALEAGLPDLLITEVCYNDIPRERPENFTPAERWQGNQIGGETADWVEIMNPKAQSVSTAGVFLTDKYAQPTRFPLPLLTLAPGERFLVYCTGTGAARLAPSDPDLPYTAPFGLSPGESVYLFRSPAFSSPLDVLSSSPSSVRPADLPAGLSWGRRFTGATMTFGFFEAPSPGAENTGLPCARVLPTPVVRNADSPASPQALLPGQLFRTGPLHAVITHPDPQATIVYTLNGTEPDGMSAIYDGSVLTIPGTAILRTRALRADSVPSGSITRTFIHTPSVFAQRDPEFPDEPICDPEVVSAHMAEILDQLELLPTVCLTTAPNATAIASGNKPERPISFEFITPSSPPCYAQENAYSQLAGNHGEEPRTKPLKNAWHILFKKKRSLTGSGSWQGPVLSTGSAVFPNSQVTSFHRLLLRSGSNDAWGAKDDEFGNPSLESDRIQIRDPYMKETQRAFGALVPQRRFVHVFLDGYYWGVYDLEEHIDGNMIADHLNLTGPSPVTAQDIRILKYDSSNSPATDLAADDDWRDVIDASISASESPFSSDKWNDIKSILDIQQYIDYIITIGITGKQDHTNLQVMGWKNPRDNRYRLIAWDGDKAETFSHINPYGPDGSADYISFESLGTVDLVPHFHLRSHPDYQAAFRLRLEGSAGGPPGVLYPTQPLGPDKIAARLEERINDFRPVLECQAMRWGNSALIGVWENELDALRITSAQSARFLKEAARNSGLLSPIPAPLMAKARVGQTTQWNITITRPPEPPPPAALRGGFIRYTISPSNSSLTIDPASDPVALPFPAVDVQTYSFSAYVPAPRRVRARVEVNDFDGRPAWSQLGELNLP